MARRRNRQRVEVSATELAEMGFCEKRIQLARLHGECLTSRQHGALRRGRVAHRQYLVEEGPVTAAALHLNLWRLVSVCTLLSAVLMWWRGRSREGRE